MTEDEEEAADVVKREGDNIVEKEEEGDEEEVEVEGLEVGGMMEGEVEGVVEVVEGMRSDSRKEDGSVRS